MDYPPNAEAVEIFCRDILPRIAAVLPSTRLYIVGKNPPAAVRALASPRVEVTGYVEDIIPFWRKASVLVVPLRMGGGTRIKILEAMALGRPVVSTTKGCEGLEVNHGTHLLIADDPDAFAHSVVRLCRDPVLYANVARAARALVERKYSFGVLEDLFRDPTLFGPRHSGTRGFREREPIAAPDGNSALRKPDVSSERR
jgi:glycosyltransferase involved in cell wall biosynthesis